MAAGHHRGRGSRCGGLTARSRHGTARHGCATARPTVRNLTKTDACASNDGFGRRRPARPAGTHRPRGDPQLLHHRAHRPRQVDPGRPDAAAHRRGRRPEHARPVPGPDGHRAGTRHHHQEPGGPAAVDRRGRPPVRAEPHRHPRPRRLLLRGVALARGVRGRRAARRRGAGHRGADAGQPLHGPRGGPADHPGAEQDRPARGPARAVRGGDRPHHRLRPRRRAARLGQDGGGRPGTAARDRQPGSRAGR